MIKWICNILGRICDWLAEAEMIGYDREILEQVEREVCEPCTDRKGCIGPVPMWGDVFPCRPAGERYWEIEAEKEDW